MKSGNEPGIRWFANYFQSIHTEEHTSTKQSDLNAYSPVGETQSARTSIQHVNKRDRHAECIDTTESRTNRWLQPLMNHNISLH